MRTFKISRVLRTLFGHLYHSTPPLRPELQTAGGEGTKELATLKEACCMMRRTCQTHFGFEERHGGRGGLSRRASWTNRQPSSHKDKPRLGMARQLLFVLTRSQWECGRG